MKNKTLRTNAMKLKKVIAASLAISVLFAFTGCGNSSSTTNTKQESSSTTETGSTDELNKNWTTFTNRKTSFLLITKMHGTKPLVL